MSEVPTITLHEADTGKEVRRWAAQTFEVNSVAFAPDGKTLASAGVRDSAIGLWDLLQTKHSLRRNYPILANIRFLLETIRPEIRQYFLESDLDGTPFNRIKRSIVYQRAKGQLDKRPFGTQLDVYSGVHEWLNHSMAPKEPTKEPFRITIGD